jgi:SAM-dependent methyltransferase
LTTANNAAFINQRERFEQTPDRYSELVCRKEFTRVLTALSLDWKKTRNALNYADVGCGEGNNTQKFSDFLYKKSQLDVYTFGVDASIDCQKPCEERGIRFSCIDLNSTRLPFKDCQVITVFDTIEHVFDTDFLLNSIRQSLSSDGIIMVTTLNVVCWKNRFLVPFGIQPFNTEVSTQKLSYGYRVAALKRRMDSWQPAGHIRPFTLYSLCDLIEDNGFKVVLSLGMENWRTFKFLERVAKNMCTSMLVVAKLK